MTCDRDRLTAALASVLVALTTASCLTWDSAERMLEDWLNELRRCGLLSTLDSHYVMAFAREALQNRDLADTWPEVLAKLLEESEGDEE